MTAVVFEDLCWSQDCLDAIEALAKTGQPFDANDLSERGLRNPPTPNQWGAAFSAANKAGLIAHAGYHRSARRSRAGGVCSLWVGKGAPQSD